MHPDHDTPERPQPVPERRGAEEIERLQALLREAREENARLARLAAGRVTAPKAAGAWETFAELVERAPFGIYVVDSRFRVATMNAGSQEGAFRNVRPVIGRDLAEVMRILWPEPVAAEIVAHFRHTLEAGEPFYSPRFTNPRRDVGIVESYEWELHRIVLPDGQPAVVCYYYDSTALRDAEQALRTATRRFQTIVDHAPIAIYVRDRDGRFVFGNKRLEQFTGRPLDELLGKTDYDFAPKEDADRWRANDVKVLGGHGVSEFEEAGTDRDGRRYVNLSVKFALTDEAGRPMEICAISTDITDRKRAEAELRESERRYRELFESMIEAYCVIEMIFDEDGRPVDFRYLETNPAFVRHATREMLGQRIKAIVPDFEPFWLEHFGRVVLTGEPAELEYVVKGLGDQWFHTAAFRIGGEGSRTVGVVFENITERKRTEEARAASRQQLQDIIDNTPAVVYALDLNARFVMANASLAELLGSTPDQMIGKKRDAFMPKEDATWHEANDRKVIQEGKALEFEEYNRIGDRSITWLTTKFPLRDAEGKIYAVAGISTDMTERKRAQQALQEANQALAEADRRKDEFIAVLSHELRNPLAPIRYALPLLGEERLGAPGRRATEVIDRQVTHLSRLVDDLLDVSRITAGKIELRRDYVVLASVVSAAVEAASPAIAAGRHSLDLSVPDAPVWLHVDAARISQAITNLLNNSAKYTPQGGRIRLEAAADEAGATIRVIDNGIGLDAQALTTVFEMFRQAGDRNRAQGGLGIGLTLARQLVEMHGGSIDAHSEGPGRGAEFVIRLPLSAGAASASEAACPTPSGEPASLRVLVADDNVDLVEMLALVVETAGHDVRKAFDGRSAVSAALEYQPNLILLDIGMPDMTGVEVAKELRRHPEMARTCIVALTGWGQAEDRRRTAEAGFDGHVTKPADPLQIQKMLEDVARRLER